MDIKNQFLQDMEAEKIINQAVIKSMVGGAIPIPIIDVAATTAVQVGMIKKLCGLYGIEYSSRQNETIIASLATSIGARFGASLVKSIPFIGGILGAPTMVTLSGVLTYATGKGFISYIRANKAVKNIKDFDISELTNRIKSHFSEGATHVKTTFGKVLNVDIEEKLKDITRKAKSAETSQEEQTEAEDAARQLVMEKARKIFVNTQGEVLEDDLTIWLNTKNKLSGNSTPENWMKEGKYSEVSQWLDILQTTKDTSYLDIKSK